MPLNLWQKPVYAGSFVHLFLAHQLLGVALGVGPAIRPEALCKVFEAVFEALLARRFNISPLSLASPLVGQLPTQLLYLDLLRSGSTKDVVELLAPFGLDARNEAFWKDGIIVSLGALIEEAEQLSHAMGVI